MNPIKMANQTMDEAEPAPEAPRRGVAAAVAHDGPRAAAEILAGAAAGAVVGALAGPPGAIAGAVIGGLVGSVAELALERDEAWSVRHEAELDEAIGVIGGHIGDARPGQPPARIGAFSAAAMGANLNGAPADSAGPMQSVESE